MPNLKDQVIEALSAPSNSPATVDPVTPVEIEDGVLLWGQKKSRHRLLYHVRDDRIVSLTIQVQEVGDPDGPQELDATLRQEAAAFLASVDDKHLDLPDETPLKRYDRKPFASLPFPAYAVIHPSQGKGKGPGKETAELFNGRCWPVFPCYENEIPDTCDTAWAKVVTAFLNYSNLNREPTPAYRVARYQPSTPNRSRKRQRSPVRPKKVKANRVLFTVRNLVEECYQVENWKGDVLQFADSEVTLLPDGPTYPVGGLTDAKNVVREFIETSEFVKPTANSTLSMIT